MLDDSLADALSKSVMGEVDSLKDITKLKEQLAKDMGFSVTDASRRTLTTHLNQ